MSAANENERLRQGAANMLSGEQTLHMLIVEDSEDDALLIYSELAAHGARVHYRRVDCAADMADALAVGEWDIIVCDHAMPGFDAMAALEMLKLSGKDIPFIICSGHISDEAAFSAMRNGVSDYVEKNNFSRLVPAIERELKSAAARRAVRRANHLIEELSVLDQFSNLPNRMLFCARSEEWVQRQETQGARADGALFYIDLDRFQRINGTFGFVAGNEVLRQAAGRLSRCFDAPGAVLGHLGSDKFCLFQPGGFDANGVASLADRISASLSEPFIHNGTEFFLTSSVGAALMPANGIRMHDLIIKAESAMAHAKRLGGNSLRLYQREMDASSGERIAMESELRRAIERNELFLHYQPCVAAESGKIVAVEALVRWMHGERGVIRPDRFIPVADESGLIADIGEWVLRQACGQAKAWHDQGYPELSISVNVSAVQFAQPHLLDTIDRVLKESRLPAAALTLEITESTIMQDAEAAADMMRTLKRKGVKIAIDDFGTGYSSLSYLKRFPIDILKIDKSFVGGLGASGEDAAIVHAIMALSKNLSLTTVAEGIETRQQADFLRLAECDYFQGFLYCPPVDPGELSRQLAQG